MRLHFITFFPYKQIGRVSDAKKFTEKFPLKQVTHYEMLEILNTPYKSFFLACMMWWEHCKRQPSKRQEYKKNIDQKRKKNSIVTHKLDIESVDNCSQ